MKNLKIRRKIVVAFGLVTLLTLVLSLYVIKSNLNTDQNAENIRAEVQLQSLCAGMMESFMSAEEAGAVISGTFNDKAYDELVAHVEACRGYIAQIRELVAQNPILESYAVQMDSAETQVEAWSTNINKVQQANKTLESLIADASANQAALTTQNMGIFSYQMQLSKEEAVLTDIASRERLERISRVEQGMDISTRLNNIGARFETMFRALDTKKLEEDLAYLDNTVNQISDFRANSNFQYVLDTTASMLSAIATYKGNIIDFRRIMQMRAAAIQQAGLSSEYAHTRLDELLTAAEYNSIAYTDVTIDSNRTQLMVIAAIAAAVVLVSAILGFYISSLISKPVLALSAFMRRAGSTGDIELTAQNVAEIEKYGKLKDEIGQCISDTAGFINHVTGIAGNLELIAQGDLTAEVELLSERDTMGNSLKTTLEQLNAMFAEIKKATDEVSGGAQHIADGAQLLAEGSAEQSATIEELSASATEIEGKTKINAKMAMDAADLVENIKADARQGSQQMSDMMRAVYEINESSMAISKVIKIIDDIAFQTNILALNAAVEAARAGHHGKGFAVVADEVRRLAAKSAEAAKNTNELIENSIRKAEHGGEISVETSASLERIVEGINESGKLVGEIAGSSDKQSGDITAINAAIDQVAHVVQQNSATAQQSAAASQQLSGQAAILEQLLAKFKLRAAGAAYEDELPEVMHGL